MFMKKSLSWPDTFLQTVLHSPLIWLALPMDWFVLIMWVTVIQWEKVSSKFVVNWKTKPSGNIFVSLAANGIYMMDHETGLCYNFRPSNLCDLLALSFLNFEFPLQLSHWLGQCFLTRFKPELHIIVVWEASPNLHLYLLYFINSRMYIFSHFLISEIWMYFLLV